MNNVGHFTSNFLCCCSRFFVVAAFHTTPPVHVSRTQADSVLFWVTAVVLDLNKYLRDGREESKGTKPILNNVTFVNTLGVNTHVNTHASFRLVIVKENK